MLTIAFVITKAPVKEAASVGPAHRTKSAGASVSFGTPKPPDFLDITTKSEGEWSFGETNGDQVADEGLVAKENNNTSAESNPVSEGCPQASLGKDTDGEDSSRELSDKDNSKVVGDVDLNEVHDFLNDDVPVRLDDAEVCLPVLR